MSSRLLSAPTREYRKAEAEEGIFERLVLMATGKKQSNSKSSNRRVDRLSVLPIPILHHILSFLPTQGVVRTCVLSKTWRNIWCSVPTLIFYDSRPDFVDAVLFQRHSSNVQKLKFTIALQKPDIISRLNNWIMYAIRHNVQHLQICCFGVEKMELPRRIFTCESLRELRLHYSIISLPNSISLLALKTLELSHVSFKNCHVEKLLFSAFTSLETLVIRYCDFYSSPLSILVISAPNLVSLKLEESSKVALKFHGNFSSMVNVHIQVTSACSESAIQLFSVLGNAQSLTLSSKFLSPFVVALQNDLSILACLQTPFCNMKWLKMGTSFSDADIFVINTILKHSPHIETIILENKMETTTTGQSFEVEKIWCVYKLSHLKQVEIKGFQASENEMKLVKAFLENAVILENLVILTSRASKSGKEYQDTIKTGRKLLSYPRASASVGILFT